MVAVPGLWACMRIPDSDDMENTKPVLSYLPGSWTLIGLAGIATLASSGAFSGSVAPWVALVIFLSIYEVQKPRCANELSVAVTEKISPG
jgi:hypothetical protein